MPGYKSICDEFKREAKERKARNRLSPAQEELIRLLEEDVGWGEDPAILRQFLLEYTGVEEIGWLTPEQAQEVIRELGLLSDAMKNQVKRP